MATTPLPGFVASSRGLLQEEGGLPKACTSDGFDPNAYKLMKRFGNDFRKPPLLGSVIKARPYGLNDTQKMIQKQGGGVVTPRIGHGHILTGENFRMTQGGVVTCTMHYGGRSHKVHHLHN